MLSAQMPIQTDGNLFYLFCDQLLKFKKPFARHETENRIHNDVGNGISRMEKTIIKIPLIIPHIPAISDTAFFEFILSPHKFMLAETMIAYKYEQYHNQNLPKSSEMATSRSGSNPHT